MTQAIATIQSTAPQMIRYDAACKALAACSAVDEVQDIRNKAEAMRAYGRQANNKKLEVTAAEIRIRAERRLGELIIQQKAEGGLNPGARGQLKGKDAAGVVLAVVSDDRQKMPTLAEAGISKDLSSRAQKLAAVPHAEFEAEVKQWKGRVDAEGRRVTTRLEQAGERASASNDVTPEDYDGPDLAELVDELQAENTRLIALIQAAEADDLKAEAIKWRRAYEHAAREQGVAMNNAAKCQDREKWIVKLLRRCAKAVGVADPNHTDPRDIAKAVESYVARIPA